MSTPLVYGAQFWRLPTPTLTECDDLAQRMAEDGYTLARLFPTWDWCNPEPNRYDFSDLLAALDSCSRHGLEAMVTLSLESAPYWLAERHPEARYHDADRRTVPLQGRSSYMTGGWPGLSLTCPAVRTAAGEYIAELGAAIGRHDGLVACNVWNEPRIEPARGVDPIPGVDRRLLFDYGPWPVGAFRRWLLDRYQGLDGVNAAWLRRYTSSDQIDPPTELGQLLEWVDWRRFWLWQNAELMRFRSEDVRTAFPAHVLVGSHAAHHPPVDETALLGTDAWKLAQHVDVWGASVFAPMREEPLWLTCAGLDITRANADGRPWWVTELQGGRAHHGRPVGREVTPGSLRSACWLGLAAGATGIVYWSYSTEVRGLEAGGFGLLDRAGASTDRSRAAAELGSLLADALEQVGHCSPVPEAGLIFDPDSALLDFALAGDEVATVSTYRGWVQALFEADIAVDYLHAGALDAARLEQYRLLVWPGASLHRPSIWSVLAEWTHGGGHLVLEHGCGSRDSRLHLSRSTLPPELVELAGVVPGGALAGPESAVTAVTVAQGELHTSGPVTPLTALGSAHAIATCDGMTVATSAATGHGATTYYGFPLGTSLAPSGIARAHAGALCAASAQPPARGERLRPRVLAGDGAALLVVANPENVTIEEEIDIRMNFETARQLGADNSAAQGPLRVAVAAQDASAYLLTGITPASPLASERHDVA